MARLTPESVATLLCGTLASPFGLAVAAERESPDPEMLRMMELLKEMEMLREIELMRAMDQMEKASAPERDRELRRSTPAKKKETTR